MANVSQIRNCYGCGVCATVCARNIIDIRLNKDGFYEPVISSENKCTNCGLCVEVCSFSHTELASTPVNIRSYASWSNNKAIQRKASSGGVGFEIAKQGVERGYKFCGCRYNPHMNRAEHYVAETVEEAIPSIGSKYIQSYTCDGFKAINRKEKYIVTGTPCQIDSFRRYIKKFRIENNFILMDFFCHAVPSMWAWKKYCHEVEKITGRITNAIWRNKLTGWHDSWVVSIDGEKGQKTVSENRDFTLDEHKSLYNSWFTRGDVFYKMFLGDFCCNPACQNNCKFKYDKSSADIRIGDLWGNEYRNNEDGVSALITFTPKGEEVVSSLNNVTIKEHKFDVVAEGQMKENAKKAHVAWLAKIMLNNDKQYSMKQWKLLIKLEGLINLPKRIVNKIKWIMSR